MFIVREDCWMRLVLNLVSRRDCTNRWRWTSGEPRQTWRCKTWVCEHGLGTRVSDCIVSIGGMDPTNVFVEFRKIDIEQAISERFEQQVCRYPQRLAVKTR